MGGSVSRTISLHGGYVALLGAILVVLGGVLPVWSVYHRTLSETAAIEIVDGPLRPAMILLPPMADGAIFSIAESKVTQSHFYRIMGGMPGNVAGLDVRSWETCPAPFNRDTFEMPVTCITLSQMVDYANRLTEIENRVRARTNEVPLTFCYSGLGTRVLGSLCTGYRLPTFEEWRFAVKADARAGPSGSDDYVDHCRYAHNFDCPEAPSSPRAAKELLPNRWHLYDLQGNTAEVVAPKGSNNSGARVLGSSWRDKYSPDSKDLMFSNLEIYIGFRLTRTQ